MFLYLANGERYELIPPVFVLMKPGPTGFHPEPVWYPGGSAVAIYTDDDLAARGRKAQQMEDLAGVPISDQDDLWRLIEHHEQHGAVNVGIDLCTNADGTGGLLIPIPVALGRNRSG